MAFTSPVPTCMKGKASDPSPTLAWVRVGKKGAQTWLDFLDNGLAAPVSHLLDIQQVMRVPIVRWPEIHKDPGAAAPTINNNPVVQR